MFHVEHIACRGFGRSCQTAHMPAWEDVVLDCWRQGQSRSAVGPGPVEAHLEHARLLAHHLRSDDELGIDLGTGVGIPGLALAGFRPDMRWILIDAAQRRIQLVATAIEELGWSDRVQAVHGRAEDPAVVATRQADVVIARLFGPPAATAECAAPLVRPGGRVLVTEPPESDSSHDSSATGARWPADGLRPLGLSVGDRSLTPSLQTLEAVAEPEARFPRKPGVALRRPLW